MHQLALAVAVFGFVIPQAMTARPARPEDLFRFQRIGAIAWSPDGTRAAVEIHLVHGDQDFVPVQQAEEFFTALYRQDRRAQLVRHTGEEHTIAARQNVLDMWKRFESWLRETMPRD